MKHLFTFLVLALTTSTLNAQCTDLFFSEYIEGSSSNKAIEIYNPTPNSIDLSNYTVYRNNNGATTPTDNIVLNGTLASGDVYVIANSSAGPEIIAVKDTLHTLCFFNGDDAVWLQNTLTGDTLDIIGIIGDDPGTGWAVGTGATNNFTLVRMANVNQGTMNWAIGATQWEVFPIDMFDSIGDHTMNPCGACIPTSSSITPTACDSYTAPDGSTYNMSGLYTAIIPNTEGCDSTISIDLTINTSDLIQTTQTACDSIEFEGNSYYYSGVYQVVLTNVNLCDSIRELVATINHSPAVPTTSMDQMLCDGETPTDLTASNTISSAALIISGICDATLTGGLPKAIEFYAIENIADLSIYGFGSANNGGGTNGEEFTFPAIALNAGDYYRVGTDSVNFNSFFGFDPENSHSTAGNVNGDDAIELFMNGSVIDVFGDINTDGSGQPWEYLDGWAYRIDGSVTNGGTFIFSEWNFSGPNALDGEASNATAATPFPIGSFTTSLAPPSYEWFDDAALMISLGMGGTYTPATTLGTSDYYVTGTANGCSSEATQVDVTINILPMVTYVEPITELCDYNSPITLSGESPMGGIFSGNGVSAMVFDPANAALGANTITYSYTDANNCTSLATSDITVDQCLGINEIEAKGFVIYPNPTNGVFTIEVKDGTSNEISVKDITGKTVYSSTMNNSTVNVDLSVLKAGQYFVELTINNTIERAKLIIK